MSRVRAACLIIGDEILNGKVTDTNSRFFAKYCFSRGIQLGEICTVPDEEDAIVSTLHRLCSKFDFVVTTGGIGPTHDDITYECVAKSFKLPCALDKELQARMRRLANPEAKLDKESLEDYYRMATLPTGNMVKNYYVCDDLWVPICSIDHKVYIFPGIPQLFSRLLESFSSTLEQIYNMGSKESSSQYLRFYIKTAQSEAHVSRHLREFQDKANAVSKDIKIGSYPHFGLGFNTISVIGDNNNTEYLQQLVSEIIERVGGELISNEDEDKFSNIAQ